MPACRVETLYSRCLLYTLKGEMPACRVEIDVIRVREASILQSLKGEMPACKVETSDSYTPSNLGIQTLKGEMPACRVETEMSAATSEIQNTLKGEMPACRVETTQNPRYLCDVCAEKHAGGEKMLTRMMNSPTSRCVWLSWLKQEFYASS